MSPDARYGTQAGRLESLKVRGVLTDTQIERYKREGFYGPDVQARTLALDKQRKHRSRRKHIHIDFSQYDSL